MLSNLYRISIYREYCSIKNKSFKDDNNFILSYTQIFFCKRKLYEYVEDKDLTYINYLYIVHVMVYKTLKIIHTTTFHYLIISFIYSKKLLYIKKNLIYSLERHLLISL